MGLSPSGGPPLMTDVTQILSEIEHGDPTAAPVAGHRRNAHRLGRTRFHAGQLFKLRYFPGCSIEESREILGFSRAIAH